MARTLLFDPAMLRLTVAFALAATGCSLYFPDGGEGTPDAHCNLDGGAPDADLGLRNPDNLRCEAFGRPGECDPACGPCRDSADQAPLPPWGECGGRCDTLSEPACLVDVECRAAYDYNCYTGAGPCTSFTPFLGCFSLSRWAAAGACEGLDSWSCSGRSDCVALHQEVCDPAGQCWPQFVSCTSENRAAPADR